MDAPRAKGRFLVGVGGIGSGMFFRLRGDHTLGRNESRAGSILRRRDFCKLHIIAHYVAALTDARAGGFGVYPIGRVGDDEPGRRMLEHMRAAGMDDRFVAVDPEAPTLLSVCFIYADGDGGNITTDDSACSRVTADDVDAALAELDAAGGIAVAAPEAPLAARMRLLELARGRGWLTASAVTTGEVPAALDAGMFALTDLVGLNRDEAATVAGAESAGDVEAVTRAAGERLAALNPHVRLCVTAGGEGAFAWAAGRVERTPAAEVEVVNTAGAGDAALAGLIVGVSAGLAFIGPDRPARSALADAPPATAVDLAMLVAGASVLSQDTINFDLDRAAVARLAGEIGADASALLGRLGWSGGDRHG